MVYQKKFVAVVKCGGKVLRERDNDTVYLPFGSEYSVLLKNLNSRAAQVDIEIDGTDVLYGSSLIIQPGQDVELERFLSNDLNKGNRFKFIQKTKEIADHRGDRVDDGIIRVEYRFAMAPPEIKRVEEYHHHHHHNTWWPYWVNSPPRVSWGDIYSSTTARGGGGTYTASCNANIGDVQVSNCCDSLPVFGASPDRDEGITVPGSVSNQQFQQGYIGQLEAGSEVIILRLRGVHSQKQVINPVTVKTKISCPTCGRSSAASAAFCANCGTAL